MSTEWDGKPPHERAEEWRERLVLALGREQGLRLALAEREISVTLLKRIERDHPALVGHYRYCLRQERLNGNQYLWDQEGANIPPYETGSVWLSEESLPPAPGYSKSGKSIIYCEKTLEEWVKK